MSDAHPSSFLLMRRNLFFSIFGKHPRVALLVGWTFGAFVVSNQAVQVTGLHFSRGQTIAESKCPCLHGPISSPDLLQICSSELQSDRNYVTLKFKVVCTDVENLDPKGPSSELV